MNLNFAQITTLMTVIDQDAAMRFLLEAKRTEVCVLMAKAWNEGQRVLLDQITVEVTLNPVSQDDFRRRLRLKRESVARDLADLADTIRVLA